MSGHANGNGWGDGSGVGGAGELEPITPAGMPAVRRPVAVGPGTGPGELAAPAAAPLVLTVPRVSPLRGVQAEGTLEVVIRPAATAAATPSRPSPPAGPAASEPESVPVEPASFASIEPDGHDEPPLTEELARTAAAAAEAPTAPMQALPGQTLHIRFLPAPQEFLVAAFGALRELIHAHPGETPVLLGIPSGGAGTEQRMQLRRGVAYDAEFVSAVKRRLGESAVELRLDS
jgi:hypothetical protein